MQAEISPMPQKDVIVEALQAGGLTERQAELVVRFGIEAAETIDMHCDTASRMHTAECDRDPHIEYVVCSVVRDDLGMQWPEYRVFKRDNVREAKGEVTPIWSSTYGFDYNFDLMFLTPRK